MKHVWYRVIDRNMQELRASFEETLALNLITIEFNRVITEWLICYLLPGEVRSK